MGDVRVLALHRLCVLNLLLVGAVRAWDDFDAGDATTYMYVGGLVVADLALLDLYVRAERLARP